jgi:hypothetical protein
MLRSAAAALSRGSHRNAESLVRLNLDGEEAERAREKGGDEEKKTMMMPPPVEEKRRPPPYSSSPFLSLSQPSALFPPKKQAVRSFMTYVPSVGDAKPRTITLIPGDGIGPEISHAVEDVVSELGAPIEWERFPGVSGSTPRGEPVTEVPADVLASIRRNKVCFKGTLFTPLSEHNTSTQSLNVQLRKGKKREERGEDLRERERGSQRPFSTTEVFFNGKKIEKRNFNKRQLSTSMSTSATASTPPGCPPGLRGSTSSSSGKTPKVCHFLFRSFLFLVSFPRNSLAQKKLAFLSSLFFLSLLSALLSGEYSGLEHEVVPDVVESLKVITLEKSKRTAEYAFGMAFLNNRKKVPPDFFLSSFLSPFFSCCDPLSLSLSHLFFRLLSFSYLENKYKRYKNKKTGHGGAQGQHHEDERRPLFVRVQEGGRKVPFH